jgi:peptidyl-prolyl cis-trans isomerase D
MLQQIRDKITGWFATVFLGAIAVVFVFWGIRFESGTSSYAAKVNGESIPVELVRQAWQQRQTELQQRTRDELPEAVVKSEQKQLLDEFVNREVLIQHVNAMGYRVSDAQVAAQIEAIPALQVDGKFSRDRYAVLLRQEGRTEGQFEQQFRRDLELDQLRGGIGISAFVTRGELGRRLALEGETRRVDYYTIASAPFAAGITPTPAGVQAYYDQHKASYTTPEKVSLQYVALKASDVAAGIQVTDAALHDYYAEVASERYMQPERRRARHILVEEGKDDAAAKAKAESIYQRAKAGEDFAKLAEENSDDPGSKAQGGELGWATRESYVPAFADALFSMKKGEIRGPVKTQFGYHVIELEDVEPAHQRSFEEVRPELEADYRNEKSQSIFYEKSQQLADDAFAALTELDSVAKKDGLELKTVDGFTRKGGGPFDANRKVIDAVFSDEVLQERQNSPAIDVSDGEVVVLRVTDHTPATQRPLDEVRPEIEAALRQEGARRAAEAAALVDAGKVSAGTPLAELAQAAGVKPAGEATVGRTSDAIPAALRTAMFKVARPAPGKASGGAAVLESGDVAVFAVTSVQPGTAPTGDAAAVELAQTMQRAANAAALAEFTAYRTELERTAKVKLNPNVFGATEAP